VPREYTIAGGLTDAQRLARQAHVMAGATQRFLDGIGLTTGWSCLDVGCGDGQVTIAMARAAGPDARVVGVDVDAEALDVARTATAEAGVTAEFIDDDAAHPLGSGAFDLAYARLVLSHLVDPSAVVRGETVDDKLFLAQLVRNMRASILEAGAATDAEIDALEADVAAAARDPATAFFQARIHQVSGRRPAG
jgi:2-polyprenyl-3-methyl-5-hydroxy-6-metoxy-1,4-benzoquinol methylase